MSNLSITFHDVAFSYGTGTQLFENLNLSFHRGWTGIVGANGAGKSTLLKLATGLLRPQQGIVDLSDSIYCPQRTDFVPDLFEDFIAGNDARACKLRGKLGVRSEWLERWETLSHGERKRAQIAVALWSQPGILAVDEPMNHLDLSTRRMLAISLKSYRGVGLLVSHDRDLLDSLCYQCLFVDPPHAIMRPGGVTKGLEQERREDVYNTKQYRLARKEYKRLQREAVRRRNLASQQQRRRSKRGLDRSDSDARAKRDLARVSGKDGVAGKLLRQLDGRLRQTQRSLENMPLKKSYTLGIWLEGSFSRRDSLFMLKSGRILFGSGGSLEFPDLAMRPRDRIALTGPNGSGKSTMIEKIVSVLQIPDEYLIYIPQEVPLSSSKAILKEIHHLPNERLGHLMTIISRLGSRPARLLESEEPSPGEMRKLLLALGMVHYPHLIIMDEPTNHLDIRAIDCLERALQDCPCGMLLVSHDRQFLNALTRTRWDIRPKQASGADYVVEVS